MTLASLLPNFSNILLNDRRIRYAAVISMRNDLRSRGDNRLCGSGNLHENSRIFPTGTSNENTRQDLAGVHWRMGIKPVVVGRVSSVVDCDEMR
jgi:hypothetical protein